MEAEQAKSVKQLERGGRLVFSSMLMEALLGDTLLLAGGGLVTQEHKWDRLLTDYPTDILPFPQSSGIGVDSSGARL